MPADQSGSILPTVRYPSFLKSTRPYPRWHKVVHHTYVFIFFILVVALPITHATTKQHRPTSWELWTVFGSMLGAYVLYRVRVRERLFLGKLWKKKIGGATGNTEEWPSIINFFFRHGFFLCIKVDTIRGQRSLRDHKATRHHRCHLLQIDTQL